MTARRTDHRDTGDLLTLLEAAGLTGRGGAAFSTAVKVRASRENGAALIVNACDGEVGAAKDAFVVAEHLDELVAGAELVTSRRGRRPSTRYAAHRGSATEARLRAAGLDVLPVPARYVSSEETSLISLAQGGLARPMTRRAPFVQGGTDSAGRRISPTVVLNAETVWRIAQVAQWGPQWFRQQGLPDEPGPRLVAIGGAVPRPRVVETAAGAPISALLGAAGAEPSTTGTVIVGGLGGIVLPAQLAWQGEWSTRWLTRAGGRTGAGVLHVLDPAECPVNAMTAWLDYAAGESAGQCGPCMFGLPAIAGDWRELATGSPGSGAAYDRLLGRAASVRGRGACHFPDGVSGLVLSAVDVLAEHLEVHAAGRCAVSAVHHRSSHERAAVAR
jgi:NADH:ubiquinone oxidoreductase subunit F (NADH-binding)